MKHVLLRNLYLIVCCLFGHSLFAQTYGNPTAKSYLVKTTGEKLFGKVQIQRALQGNFTIVFNDSANFDLGKISQFENTEGWFAVVPKHYLHPERSFTENILLKRVIIGKADVYSKYDLLLRRPGSIPYDYFSIKHELLQEVEYTNLRSALRENSQSMKLLNHHQNYKRLTLLLFGAGFSTTFYGIAKGAQRKLERPSSASYQGPGFRWTSAAYVGMGITLSAFIPYFLKDNKLKQALDAYNQR